MSTVKVGVMPGRVQEFAVEGTTTFDSYSQSLK
jgi:hypothetical protein